MRTSREQRHDQGQPRHVFHRPSWVAFKHEQDGVLALRVSINYHKVVILMGSYVLLTKSSVIAYMEIRIKQHLSASSGLCFPGDHRSGNDGDPTENRHQGNSDLVDESSSSVWGENEV
nr:hypothetical protein CFP56_73200 [Quercus suber]